MGPEVGGEYHPQHRSIWRYLALPRVISALGIRFVGERTGEFLAEHLGLWKRLLPRAEKNSRKHRKLALRLPKASSSFSANRTTGYSSIG